MNTQKLRLLGIVITIVGYAVLWMQNWIVCFGVFLAIWGANIEHKCLNEEAKQ